MAVLTKDTEDNLVKLLIDEGLADRTKLDSTIAKSKKEKKPLLTLLVGDKVIDGETLTHLVAFVSDVPYVNLTNSQIDQKVLDLLPSDVAERNMAVPIAEVAGRLALAMVDATNVQSLDYLTTLIGRPIRAFMASEESVKHVLEQYKTDLTDVDAAAKVSNDEDVEDKSNNIRAIVQDSPISKALNSILEYAVRAKASDIHIEPYERALMIRCRIDGVLREVMKLPRTIEPALISRIKIMAGLKIDEHRIPQDGEFPVKVGEKEVDLRIAICPVIWGEQVVIRLLDKTGSSFDLQDMGYAGRALRTIRKGIDNPNGMILTSGPTGSGKSTSLYALIKEVKNETINIITLENPVEYKMDGVNQIQINEDAGLTFAAGLRSVLRLDPDVVLVGEIRDEETARLAVEAALTGHLVFSTLHTNSAAGILPRLIDMGIEPFLLASVIRVVIGQRLLRRVGEKRESIQSTDIEAQFIKESLGELLPKTQADVAAVSEDLGYKDLPLATSSKFNLVKGLDRPTQPGGYKGRAGVYEVMEINEEIQKLIVNKSTSGDIQKASIANGMLTMRQDGFLKALNGVTTVEEVNRVTADMG